MIDGQVTPVENSNLNVQFLGTSPSDATDYLETKSSITNSSEFKYAPIIVGSTTGIVSTYALFNMWPERKTIGIALFGGGLWSAYNGYRMYRK